MVVGLELPAASAGGLDDVALVRVPEDGPVRPQRVRVEGRSDRRGGPRLVGLVLQLLLDVVVAVEMLDE